jgi:hypothetical protein
MTGEQRNPVIFRIRDSLDRDRERDICGFPERRQETLSNRLIISAKSSLVDRKGICNLSSGIGFSECLPPFPRVDPTRQGKESNRFP